MQVSSKIRSITRRGSVAVGALAVAGAVVVTGAVTSASAAPAHPHATGGKIAFWLVASDETHQTGVVHGAITGAGPSVSHDQYDVAKLNGGTFRLNHPDKTTKYSMTVNPKTCYATFTLKGTFTIDHATGRFAGYTGKGTYTGSGAGVLKRTKAGKCNPNVAGYGTAFVVKGTGTVTKK